MGAILYRAATPKWALVTSGSLAPEAGQSKCQWGICRSLSSHIRWLAFGEHFALGAGTYAGFGAIGGPQRRWQVGVSGTLAVAGVKEFYGDLLNHKDTPKMATFHFLSILGGAGAVAAFYH